MTYLPSLLCLLVIGPLYAQGIRINEILFAPTDTELEFIELLNHTTRAIDLCALSFSDNRDTMHSICSGERLIAPSGIVVLSRNGPALEKHYPESDPVTPPKWPALNNSGDAVRIFEGVDLLDEVSYASSWGRPGYSIERIDPAVPSHIADNWGVSIAPAGATPGKRNSRYSPDRVAPRIVLAEIQAPRRLFVAWNEPIALPELDVSNFRIRQQEPQQISIVSDSVHYLIMPTDIEGSALNYRNVSDLAGNAAPATSTPLSFIPARGDLKINEIMYEPQADAFDLLTDQPEYIELVNTASHPLSLRWLVVTGRANEKRDADTLRSTALYPVLPALGYALIFADAYPGGDYRYGLTSAFPSLGSVLNAVTFLPVSQSTLRLNNGGDIVRISVSPDVLIDETSYVPSWHHPSLVSTRGIALERRSLSASSTRPESWSSSVDPEGGTPGRLNSIQQNSSSKPVEATVLVTPSPFSPDGDGIDDAVTIRLQIKSPPQSLRIRIFDDRGRLVRFLVREALAGSEATYVWEGRTDAGQLLPVGIYVVLIELLDIDSGKNRVFKETAVLAKKL